MTKMLRVEKMDGRDARKGQQVRYEAGSEQKQGRAWS